MQTTFLGKDAASNLFLMIFCPVIEAEVFNDVFQTISMHAAQPLLRSHFARAERGLRALCRSLCVARNLRPGSTFPNNETAH